MLWFGKTKVAKEKSYGAKTKAIKIWGIDVDKIVISKLIGVKTNSKYLIRYSDKDVKPLVLTIPKKSGYV